MTTPTRIPASPYAFENVRPTRTFGCSASFGMKVAPPNSMYASSMSTIALGAASAMRRRSGIGISRPVGLLGVLRKIIRVRGVTAAMTASVGNTNPGAGGIRTAVAPTAAVEFGYGSKAGSGMIVSASWIRAREMWPMAAIRIPSSSPLVSRTHSGSTSKCCAQARTSSGYDG